MAENSRTVNRNNPAPSGIGPSMPTGGFRLVLVFMSGLVLMFILAPIAGMILSTEPLQITETLRDQEVTDSIWLTLITSFAATLIFSLAAIPFAYFLARKNFRFKNLVTGIIDLPVVIPHSAAGIAILGIIAGETLLGKTAGAMGFQLVGSKIAISLAMAYVSLPFLINAARDGFEAVPIRLEKAAMNLGAGPLRVFYTIALPLAKRSIISGLVLMFARGMSEFGAVIMVAYHPMITPILIYERFGAFGLRYARPVALIFILICLAVFLVFRILSKQRKG